MKKILMFGLAFALLQVTNVGAQAPGYAPGTGPQYGNPAGGAPGYAPGTGPQYGNPAGGAPGYAPGTGPQYGNPAGGAPGYAPGTSPQYGNPAGGAPGYAPGTSPQYGNPAGGAPGYAPGTAPQYGNPAAGAPRYAPGTAPHLPLADDPSASGSSYNLNQPVNQGGVNGVIGVPGTQTSGNFVDEESKAGEHQSGHEKRITTERETEKEARAARIKECKDQAVEGSKFVCNGMQ